MADRSSTLPTPPPITFLLAVALATGCSADDAPVGVSGDETTTGGSTLSVESTTEEPTTTEGTTEIPPADTTEDSTTGPPPDPCGDGIVDDDEQCDGMDLNGEDCLGQGFFGGELGCTEDCTFDIRMCISESCGDGIANGMDVCDGTDLGAETCATLGFDGGVLVCDAGCMAFDATGCHSCGDGVAEGPEDCDGADLLGESCVSQGFAGGPLTCAPGCGSFDTSACTTCGDDDIDSGEACDGSDLGGQSCGSLGLGFGVLACAADCSSYDTTGCVCEEENIWTAIGPVVTFGNTDAEDDSLPQSCAAGGSADHVIAFTALVVGSYVFDTVGSTYDTALVVFGSCDPGSELACNDDSDGTLQSQVVVNLVAGQTVFVVVDGFATNTGDWVLNITPPSPSQACEEQDVFAALGNPVATGNTNNSDEDVAQSCGAGGGPDRMIRFVAPASTTFTIDTFGSGYDTVLAAYGDCQDGSELACNDDAGGTLQSALNLPLSIGDEVLIAVSGYSGATGPWQLNINPPAEPACIEEDLLATLGNLAASGNTSSSDEDVAQSCGGGGGPDRMIRFIAPATATFTFDTFGSGHDTVLAAYDACGAGTEFACNDDAGGTLQSQLTLPLVEAQQVVIAVSGFAGSTGPWVLNIHQL
jgi:hypothetical protein